MITRNPLVLHAQRPEVGENHDERDIGMVNLPAVNIPSGEPADHVSGNLLDQEGLVEPYLQPLIACTRS